MTDRLESYNESRDLREAIAIHTTARLASLPCRRLHSLTWKLRKIKKILNSKYSPFIIVGCSIISLLIIAGMWLAYFRQFGFDSSGDFLSNWFSTESLQKLFYLFIMVYMLIPIFVFLAQSILDPIVTLTLYWFNNTRMFLLRFENHDKRKQFTEALFKSASVHRSHESSEPSALRRFGLHFLVPLTTILALALVCMRHHARQVVRGEHTVSIVISTPISYKSEFWKLGEWGEKLYLADKGKPDSSPDEWYPIPWRRQFWHPWKLMDANVTIVSKSAVICMTPVGNVSRGCEEMQRNQTAIALMFADVAHVLRTRSSDAELSNKYIEFELGGPIPQSYVELSHTERLLRDSVSQALCEYCDQKPEEYHCNADDVLVSPPVRFIRDKSDTFASNNDKHLLKRISKTLIDIESHQASVEKEIKVVSVGFASADGKEEHNYKLAKSRAEHVRKLLHRYSSDSDNLRVEILPIGENHLGQGMLNSRSVRIAVCLE